MYLKNFFKENKFENDFIFQDKITEKNLCIPVIKFGVKIGIN